MEKIQKRLNALRNIQLEIDQAESKLSEEIILLECKHAPIFDALYKKREAIVNGEREPNEDEAKWEYENVDLSKEVKFDTSKPGIPGFWLRVLEQGNLTNGIILEDDKPILKHLKNIKLKQSNQKPYGFTLEFHFEDNEYFKNKVLTKSYEFTLEKDKRNPLNSTNNSLYKCTGCVIEWNAGKSPVKDSDDEESGSFFDFFRTHTPDGLRPTFSKAGGENKSPSKNGNGKKADDDAEDDEDELEHLFELDYEIGKFIKDMIIPKALLFYTREINELHDSELEDDDDDDDDDDDEDDDDDNENDDDDDDEPDTKPKKKVKTK